MSDINLFKTENSIYLKKIKSKSELSKKDNCDGYLIESSEKEARRIIESLRGSGKSIGIVGEDDAFNRRVVETLKVDYLISPERGLKVDSLKQRDSGINHVVAKIVKEKRIVIVFDMTEIRKLRGAARGIHSMKGTNVPFSSGKELALRLGRLIQNVKICRKAGCKIKIASLAAGRGGLVDEKGRIAIGVSFGMSSRQGADAVSF